MKRGQIEKVRARLVERGVDVVDVQLEHAQGGLFITLRDGGVRLARGTWLIEYGSHHNSSAVLYREGRCLPVGHDYMGRGWIEKFCDDVAKAMGTGS